MGAHPVPGRCESEWWKYVYSPERLAIQEPCVTVRGVALEVRHPPDGDAIVYLKLDPEYAHFAKDKNFEGFGKGVIELEIICKHPVWKFLVFRCWSCINKIPVPRVGDHVEADGVYVEDRDHEQHMEIHPVTRIMILGK